MSRPDPSQGPPKRCRSATIPAPKLTTAINAATEPTSNSGQTDRVGRFWDPQEETAVPPFHPSQV